MVAVQSQLEYVYFPALLTYKTTHANKSTPPQFIALHCRPGASFVINGSQCVCAMVNRRGV